MSEIKPIELEYIYVTIPAEYICVYHRILAMMADFGEDMLKDCKASCTDKNSGVIECFNMFNSAVAAKKLGKDKLAEVIIKYVKAKINQIYKGADNSTSFVFPVDETGQLKAFVSCGARPHFEINADNGELYEHKLNNGFDEHFRLGPEDEPSNSKSSIINDIPEPIQEMLGLSIVLKPRYEEIKGEMRPCADITVTYNGRIINLNYTTYQYYFDDKPVKRFNDVANLSTGVHNFKIVVTYNGQTKIESVDKYYGKIDSDVQPEQPSESTKNKDEMYKTTISTKSIPYYTARTGKIYYTDQLKISMSELENNSDSIDTINLENEIRELINNPRYVVMRNVGEYISFDSISEAYNYVIENKNLFVSKNINIFARDIEKKYWFRKTNGAICKVDYPPYGILRNDKSVLPDIFPDKLDIDNEFDDINKKYVLWLRKKQDRIPIRDVDGSIIDITDRFTNKIKTWKTSFFQKIVGHDCKARVIRISRKHHIKYGYAYYKYERGNNCYIRLKHKITNKNS